MNIVLSGHSCGIGRAIACHLGSCGHLVFGLSRSSGCDVSSWDQVHGMASAMKPSRFSPEALITCAGIQSAIGKTTEADPLEWARVVRTNLEGTFNVVRAFRPLLTGRRPKIICFSGGGSQKGRPYFSAYSASKSGVVRLVECIAEEEGDALDITAVAPGGINTRLTDQVLALGASVAGDKEFASARHQKEDGGGDIKRVLSLVDYLISPASDHKRVTLWAAQWDTWEAAT